jgi:hypothetical protein
MDKNDDDNIIINCYCYYVGRPLSAQPLQSSSTEFLTGFNNYYFNFKICYYLLLLLIIIINYYYYYLFLFFIIIGQKDSPFFG